MKGRGWKLTGSILAGVVGVYAQVCVPDVSGLTGPGYTPDTFKRAYVDSPYAMVFSFIIPTDTLLNGVTVIIDSVIFDTVLGLPAGFTWQTDRPSRIYYGGDTGCILISGLPQSGQEGVYWTTLVGTGYGHVQGLGIPVSASDSVSRQLIVCSAPGSCPGDSTATGFPELTVERGGFSCLRADNLSGAHLYIVYVDGRRKYAGTLDSYPGRLICREDMVRAVSAKEDVYNGEIVFIEVLVPDKRYVIPVISYGK